MHFRKLIEVKPSLNITEPTRYRFIRKNPKKHLIVEGIVL